MPVIKSAIKKMRRDKKRELENDFFRLKVRIAIKSARIKKSQVSIKEAVSLIDKAVKNNLLHKNKAARIKSSLSKIAKPVDRTVPKKTTPKTPTSKKSKVTTAKK